MHVLVVGASKVYQRILENNFCQFEYHEPAFVKTGDTALKCLGDISFRLVIVNKQLPDMSGVEFASELRSVEEPRYHSILLIGGEFTRAEIVEAIQSGVNRVVAMPVTVSELKQVIDRAWKMSG